MASKFQPPKWCQPPRSPARHKQKLLLLASQDGKGPSEIEQELFDKAVYTIGRNADIQLKGELASRMHAAVLQDVEGKRHLVDLKSTHGTFLDSKKLTPHVPVEWPLGTAAQFGSGPKAEAIMLGTSQDAETASKRRRTGEVEVDLTEAAPPAAAAADPMAALYGDLPEATQVAAKVEAPVKLPALPPPVEDPTKVLFLDIDGVLRPLHSRQDAFQNTKVIEFNGIRVPLLGNSEAKAGVDFWPTAMRALRFIVQKTEARIVLSSDWRKEEVLKDGIKSSFEEYNIPPLYSQTPDLDQASLGVIKALHSSFREKRCKEIRKWLRQHPKVTRWCVVDDVDLSLLDKEALRSREASQVFLDPDVEFVKTNPTVGLNMDIAKLAICYINGTAPTDEIRNAAWGREPAGET
eukprot:TRINITY_DN27504_c0_g1_i1.p1 TRINITY_DN27504_c0_g1~~TRINITY_DN27504_c0_g1_i1.p1  ORF type:complete len:407 (-),score=96.35 TRINITY_DN27504_c0_g1_i1:114-1334(-)